MSSASPGILQKRSAIDRLISVFCVLPLTKRIPPAQILASASYDDTIKLYLDDPTEDWYCFATLTGHESTVWSLAFSPDGRFLASSSDDLTVRIWEHLQGNKWECAAVLEGHERSIYSVSWGKGKATREGSLGWLASTGSDGLVLIHELIVRCHCCTIQHIRDTDFVVLRLRPRGLTAERAHCHIQWWRACPRRTTSPTSIPSFGVHEKGSRTYLEQLAMMGWSKCGE